MNDKQMVKEIKEGRVDKPIKALLKEFPKVKKYIINTGGSKQQAEELFNDGIILLIEKVQEQSFKLTSKMSSFLFGIVRFLYLNQVKKKRIDTFSLEWPDTIIVTSQDLEYDFEKERKLQVLEKAFKQLKDKCKKLLRLFYIYSLSIKQIASKLNYSSANSAKTQKYKCQENLLAICKTINN